MGYRDYDFLTCPQNISELVYKTNAKNQVTRLKEISLMHTKYYVIVRRVSSSNTVKNLFTNYNLGVRNFFRFKDG